MTQVLQQVRSHLQSHFATEPASASVTFLGAEPIEVLRFRSAAAGLVHYVSLGCSRHPMVDPTALLADQVQGPRAEVVLSLRDPQPARPVKGWRAASRYWLRRRWSTAWCWSPTR